MTGFQACTTRWRTKWRQAISGDAFKDVLWMVSERALVMLGALVSGVLVTRYLGPSQIGAINFAYGVQGLLVPLLLLGLESIAVRRLVTDGGQREEVRNTVWSMLTITGLIGASLLVGFAWITGEGIQVRLTLLAASLPLLLTRGLLFEWIFRARSEIRKLTRIRMCGVLAMQVAKIALVMGGASFPAFVVAMAVEPVLLYGVSRMALKLAGIDKPKLLMPPKALVASLLKESWPLLIASMAVMAYMRLDVVMLQAMVGQTEVGIYGAATRLSEIWHVLPSIVCTAFYARWIEWHASAPGRFHQSVRIFLIVMLGGTVALALMVQVLGQNVIDLVYGAAYATAAQPLKIHIWALLPVCVGCVMGQLYVIWGLGRCVLIGTLVGAVTNALLNLWWIPGHGAAGAALATAVSYAASVATPLCISPQARKNLRLIWRERTAHPHDQ